MFYCSYCRMRYDDPDGHKHCATRRMGGDAMSYGWAKDADTHAQQHLTEPTPPKARCPSCGIETEIRWLHAETGEPALPEHTSCGVRMVLVEQETLGPSTSAVRGLPEEG